MKKISLLAFIFFFSVTLNAQIEFQEHIITINADNANTVYTADIDGDGDMDVLSSSANDDKIAWYENTNGLGDFSTQHIISMSADNPYSVFAADIDGDGDIDVLSASGLDDKVAWYENVDGQGNFGVQQVISTNVNNAYSVFASDLDGDGDMDVLSTSPDDDKVVWFENLDGQGNFGSQQIITTNTDFVYSVYTADIDEDGDMDVLSASALDNKIAWYENTNGQGNFGPQQIITTNAIGATKVFAEDLDGDGDMDVLSSSVTDGKIAWYENDGIGNFGLQQVITTNAIRARCVYAADIDGDGDIDALSASFMDDKIAWYENLDGQGNFGTQQIITTNADAAHSVFASDINGDGRIDVLSASGFDDSVVWYESSGFIPVVAHQPPDLEICDDDNDGFAVFNLDDTAFIIMGGQPNIVLTFHLTQSDATNGVNEMVNTHAYINVTNPQTIYARVVSIDNGDFDTTSFELIVHNSPTPVNPTPLEVCDDDNDGFAVFDLSSKNDEIIGGEPDVSVSYYNTLLDAQEGTNPLPSTYYNNVPFNQIIYARVENIGTGCFTIVELALIVNENPITGEVTNLVVIDSDGDGHAIFDLTVKIPEILNGQTNLDVSFYESMNDANQDLNAIINPNNYVNITNPQTIFVRLEDVITSCFSVTSFNLIAEFNLGIFHDSIANLIIYPNPTSEVINLSFNRFLERIEVSIINLQGQQLMNYKLEKSANSYTIDISELAAGMYFIKIISEGGSIIKRVMKK